MIKSQRKKIQVSSKIFSLVIKLLNLDDSDDDVPTKKATGLSDSDSDDDKPKDDQPKPTEPEPGTIQSSDDERPNDTR